MAWQFALDSSGNVRGQLAVQLRKTYAGAPERNTTPILAGRWKRLAIQHKQKHLHTSLARGRTSNPYFFEQVRLHAYTSRWLPGTLQYQRLFDCPRGSE